MTRHCAGPLTASATLATTSATSSLVIITTASRTASDDHEDGKNGASSTTASLAPSPTESVGCEPHGDHWHCDGPAISTTESRSRNSTLSPSPTESIGCEPHGDHWHCDGPAITTTTQAPPAPTSGAISHTSGYNSLAGLVVLIVSFFL